jgi:hypothetical protein
MIKRNPENDRDNLPHHDSGASNVLSHISHLTLPTKKGDYLSDNLPISISCNV